MSVVSTNDPADAGSDLLALLATDHQRIQRLLDEGADLETVSREIEPHLVSEDQLLYRELRLTSADADDLVDDLLDLDHRLEEALSVSEEIGPEELAAIARLFAEHVQRQEAEAFPKLRSAVSEERLVELGDALQTVMRLAPTRPHPHSPDEGWREQLVDGFNSIVDHLFHRP
ncbi:MAG: hypothetical protein JWP02_1874 [Acidimicrobiales bacterium]|nr:hypothetical protein [Acidimicrobiales bacterium]